MENWAQECCIVRVLHKCRPQTVRHWTQADRGAILVELNQMNINLQEARLIIDTLLSHLLAVRQNVCCLRVDGAELARVTSARQRLSVVIGSGRVPTSSSGGALSTNSERRIGYQRLRTSLGSVNNYNCAIDGLSF